MGQKILSYTEKFSHKMRQFLKADIDGFSILFFFSVAVWLFMFRGFLAGELSLDSDALSYYDHIKFYVENLAQGVYPMWDPNWYYGAPNNFFLRRIGEFNPFLLIALFYYKFGFPMKSAYMAYLIVYYLTGMGGFYLVAKRILGNKETAFAAYLLLLFSSLGTRIFDAYLHLMFVPMVWFFFFFGAFTERPQKYVLLGMTFTLMITLTTYIPFYFVIIVLSFLVLYGILYPRESKINILRYWQFFKENKLFASGCFFMLLVSFLPGIMLQQETSQGTLSMPLRHVDSPDPNALTVNVDKVGEGGIILPVIWSRLFSGLQEFELGVFYIPIFAYLLLLTGLITRLNKRLALLMLWGFFFFLIGLANVTPLYNFLYSHVFFFKYFRNLHFFLWIMILPVFILALAEQLRMFLEYEAPTKKVKYALFAFLAGVHGVFVVFLLREENVIATSYIVVALSLVFFVGQVNGWFKKRRGLLFFSLLVLVVLQPIEVYAYLNRNAEVFTGIYKYDKPYFYSSLTRADKEWAIWAKALEKGEKTFNTKPTMYFAVSGFNFLMQNVDYDVLAAYVRFKFVVYDRTETLREDKIDVKRIEQVLRTNENTAFVSGEVIDSLPAEGLGQMGAIKAFHGSTVGTSRWDVLGSESPSSQDEVAERKSKVRPIGTLLQEVHQGENKGEPVEKFLSAHALQIKKNSDQFRLINFQVNRLKVKTNFPSRKFLVYNDNFYEGWRAFVNGRETHILRANVAFKGVWVPAGEQVIEFVFQQKWPYWVNLVYLGIFYFIFFTIMWFWVLSARTGEIG